jgi:hypothetical protein
MGWDVIWDLENAYSSLEPLHRAGRIRGAFQKTVSIRFGHKPPPHCGAGQTDVWNDVRSNARLRRVVDEARPVKDGGKQLSWSWIAALGSLVAAFPACLFLFACQSCSCSANPHAGGLSSASSAWTAWTRSFSGAAGFLPSLSRLRQGRFSAWRTVPPQSPVLEFRHHRHGPGGPASSISCVQPRRTSAGFYLSGITDPAHPHHRPLRDPALRGRRAQPAPAALSSAL